MSRSHRSASADMRPEYKFDYAKARLNRFAGRTKRNGLVVVVDPDIAKVFTTPESVKKVLRALITTMRHTPKPKVVAR